VLGRVPADERLRADEAAGAQVALGLEVQGEGVGGEGLPERGFHTEALEGDIGHLGDEELGAPAPARLGPPEGALGVAQEAIGGGVGPVPEGDADGGTDGDLVPDDGTRAVEGGEEAIGEREGRGGVAEVIRDDGEDVAAEVGDERVGAARPAEPSGDQAEEFVARFGAEAFVDPLEAVHVDGEEGGGG